jgi:hypothetical protein
MFRHRTRDQNDWDSLQPTSTTVIHHSINAKERRENLDNHVVELQRQTIHDNFFTHDEHGTKLVCLGVQPLSGTSITHAIVTLCEMFVECAYATKATDNQIVNFVYVPTAHRTHAPPPHHPHHHTTTTTTTTTTTPITPVPTPAGTT